MKRLILFIYFIFFSFYLFGQNNSLLKNAQDLMKAGEYSAAVSKYKECINKLSGKDKSIAQLQLVSAQSCVTALANAQVAMSSKDYDKAISEYQIVLDVNPDDIRTKALQDTAKQSKREANPSLSTSKSSISFSSSGGTEKITVSCSMTWSLVDQSSSMCSVTRSGNDITIACTPNNSTASRSTSFIVKTTNNVKEQKINIYQSGKTTTSNSSNSSSSYGTTLTVSPTNLSVNGNSGTVSVYVTTNAGSYEVSLLPSWCKVSSKNRSSFVLSYEQNNTSLTRSDWFFVKAGGKSVRVDISQSRLYSSSKGSTRTKTKSTSSSFPFQLSLPVVIEYLPTGGKSKGVSRVGGGLGIGGYGSPIHVDLLAMYMQDRTTGTSYNSAMFSVEPVWNIKRYKSDYPFNDFHFNIGPTIGYSTLTQFSFGAKIGIGIHYSDIAFVTEYSQTHGWMYGFSLRFHLAHITLKE